MLFDCGRLWTIVDVCGRLWTIVDDCGRLWTFVDVTILSDDIRVLSDDEIVDVTILSDDIRILSDACQKIAGRR